MGLSPEQMREGTREFIEAMNNKDLDALSEWIDDSMVERQLMPGMPPGKEGALAIFAMMFEAMPDLHNEIDEMIVSGNRVAMRSTLTGTQTGEMMGMPATGRSISVGSIDIVEVNDDRKVIEHRGVTDMMGIMIQTGVVPPPG